MDIIDDIRRGYELDEDEPSALLECAEHALELLADQLYATDTHFLLEFVQNAEDNEYPDTVEPTLRMTVRDSSMIISCNEVGFSEQNVRAICKIGASTKKNISGFIGEKGIGFKSVFKVADAVHVASGPYTFTFDRSRKLGMIAPIWNTSIPLTPGWTTFYLKLSESQDARESPQAELSTKLLEIKPSLLLFLKKLRIIELDVKVGVGPVSREVKIEREDQDSDFVHLTRIDSGGLWTEEAAYLIVKENVNMTNLHNSKRRSAEKTELVLAFPVDEDLKPLISPQDVHAFLPIRKFGFNFVIHGDFLTSSSREDILNDSPWNLNIRNAIVDAFLSAIHTFQEQPTLQDTWIRYLPTGIVDSFFSSVEHELLRRLRKAAIVKDSNGVYRRPDKVIYIPSAFRYEGRPLISERFMKGYYYLFDGYSASIDVPILERLGVRQMTPADFLSGIGAMDTTSLAACSNDWHETVCSKLIRIRNQSRSLHNSVQNLGILLLDDGSWKLARDANKFVFESTVAGIPRYLDYQRICRHIHPSTTPRRYELFRSLGVHVIDPISVAEKILNYRAKLPMEAHVSNALFFFNYRFPGHGLPSPAGRLKVIDERRMLDIGERLYLELPSDEGRLRRCLPRSARFVHSVYMQQISDGSYADWLDWLRDCLRLNTQPRLINGQLSPEFKEMIQRLSLSELLRVLRHFWSRWPSRTPALWRKELEESIVTLEDGSKCTIGSMHLKRANLDKYPGIPFAPVDDPESREWDFLRQIGVTVDYDAAFFIKLLIRYQNQEVGNEGLAKRIYRQLEARFDEYPVGIRDAFRIHPLVFVPSRLNDSANWLYLSDVYWSGPPSMSSKVALKHWYSDLGEFFRENLGLSDAPPSILIDELRLLSVKWNEQTVTDDIHKTVSDMLFGLSSLLEKDQLDESAVQALLRDHAVFPARLPSTELQLRKLADVYIPDRTGIYAEIFRDKVPLLELSNHVARWSKISSLLRVAQTSARYLETSVDRQLDECGTREFDENLTASYASKGDAFERVVYHGSKQKPSNRQREILSKLKEVAVFMVDSIRSTLVLADFAPISTDTEMLQVVEETESVEIIVSKLRYDASRVHVDICKHLADILDSNKADLILCARLDSCELEYHLQLEGIEAVDPQATADYSWQQSTTVQGRSSANSLRLQGTSKQSYVHRENFRGTFTGRIQSRDTFSMAELGTAIDCMTHDLPEFPPSCFHVIRSSQSTLGVAQLLLCFDPPRESESTSVSNGFSAVNEPAGQPLGKDIFTIESRSAMSDFPLDSSTITIVASGHKSSSSTSNQIALAQRAAYQKENGFLGERYVYELLSTIIGPSFGPHNWTSELRGYHREFGDYKGHSLADFTYEDDEGILTKLLYEADPETLKGSIGAYPTYHIEVKSTSSGSHEPFFISKRQLLIALSLDRHDEHDGRRHVHIIIRVWNVRNPTPHSHAIYVDPIRHILENKLKVVSDKVELMIGG